MYFTSHCVCFYAVNQSYRNKSINQNQKKKIAQPAESRPTQEVDFRIVYYNRTVCPLDSENVSVSVTEK